jgi:membrane protein implicated in regulation of membrane protease activity
LILFLTELVTPGGFYFIFFGIGAVGVGILGGFGAAGPGWFQFILFSVLSVVTLWLFRGKLLKLTEGKPTVDVDSLVGETAVASDDIGVNGYGKVEMRGTSWTAHNIGKKPLKRSERARVERVEGLTLFVCPEGN